MTMKFTHVYNPQEQTYMHLSLVPHTHYPAVPTKGGGKQTRLDVLTGRLKKEQYTPCMHTVRLNFTQKQ